MRHSSLVAAGVLASGLTALPSVALVAQERTGGVSLPAVGYQETYDHLTGLHASAIAVAAVDRRLVLRRDVAEFTLDGGHLYLLPPIGGRTVAVAYQGNAAFEYAPTHAAERRHLTKVYKAPTLSTSAKEIVFLFSDTTLVELQRAVTFKPGSSLPGGLSGRVREMVNFMSDPDSKSPDPDVMADLLNRTASDLFYAHVVRNSGEPVMFRLNPYEVEGVRLLGRARRVGWTRVTDVVSQERRQGDTARVTSERWSQAKVVRYALDVSLPRNGAGDVSFSAAARMDISASATVGPWVAFGLFPKLQVDSAQWADGTTAVVYKRKDAPEMWLRLDRTLQRGEARRVTVYYHGDLIDRYADFFFIKSSSAWYPVALEGRTKAIFDVTFNTPRSYLFASVGERVDSVDAPDRMVRTRWVTDAPIRNASFNLGLFKDYPVQAENLPPISVLWADKAHRPNALGKASAKEDVGQDVLNALKLFQHLFGNVPVKRFYATEIPYSHGEAFPGLVHLSLATFVTTDQSGFDEFFRAHEVAHQWWGIGVDYATYHDRWLSEGLASFAALWYLQSARKDNKKYFDMLDRWRANIMLRRDNEEPIWLGWRVAEASDASDYNVLIYEKGAWVIHMLRILMLDLKTMKEDRFSETLREFYGSYRGERASTDDLRKVVERRVGADMRWFFDQWIYRSEIPTYRVAWQTEPAEGGKFRVRLRVRQEKVSDDFQMYVPVTVELEGDAVARARIKVQGPLTETELPLMPSKPKSVRFNDLSGVLAEVKTVGWGE